jgi:hypothetical protein
MRDLAGNFDSGGSSTASLVHQDDFVRGYLMGVRAPAYLIDCRGRLLGLNERGSDGITTGRKGVQYCDQGVFRFVDPGINDIFIEVREAFFRRERESIRHYVEGSLVFELVRCPDPRGRLTNRAVVSLRWATHMWVVDGAREVQDLLGLPPMQARLAVALISGKTLEAFARSCKNTKFTSKWHLSAMLPKFNAKTQVDLVRTLCSLLG